MLDAAIAALRRILIFQPELPRPRLELARAFFLKGEDNLARQHFERVLAGKPPEAVVKNVQRYLDGHPRPAPLGRALRPGPRAGQQRQRRFIRGRRLALRTALHGERRIETLLRGGPHRLGGRRIRASPLATIETARRRRRLATGTPRNAVQSHVDLAACRATLDHDAQRTEISLLASRRQQWSANQPAYLEKGLRLESAQRLGAQWLAIERASWHERRNEQSKHLDGPRWNFSLTGRWQASPSLSLSLSAGYAEEKPRLRSHRLTRPWGRLSASYALPLGFSVGASATVARSFFQPDWSYLTRGPAKRKDLTQTYQLSAFNRALTLFGFSPQLVIIREERESNAQLHSYQRLRGELRVVRLF